MAQITASGLKNMTGNVSKDGKTMIIGFENHDGATLSCALNQDSLHQCVTLLLNLAEESGQKFAPDDKKVTTLTLSPLPIAQIGVGRGRTESEAVLSVQTGALRLAFATELSTIVEMCDSLRSIVETPSTQRKPN